MTAQSSTAKFRDPRLDFFRGLGMFIIYIAHLPGNWWTLWIPARFGFSDATEIFVFCSGMASALAFGKIFDIHGVPMGIARVLHRIWQVYWAHICQFLVIATGLVAVQESGYLADCCNLTQDYVASLNLWPFFENTPQNLAGLLTLTYVPNYFDILPMYIVILALIPLIMTASRISIWAAFALSSGMWLAANLELLNLPAEPWSERSWFFNPFAWQLVFFTGFAFMRGWIPAPPFSKKLIAVSVAILLLSLPFAYFRIHLNIPEAQAVRDFLKPLWIKSEFGFLRYVHFLALAYLAWIAAGDKGSRLFGHGRVWAGFLQIVQKVGQQSLAVFMASLVVAQAAGVMRDMVWGRGEWTPQILSNLLGFAALIAVAYAVGWFKGQPWRKPLKPHSIATSTVSPEANAS
ncbi:OpgC family protein [Roseibium algae]|uniref:OpgC domain-containing protein n=1 Tax=Roseibium algae TaxID=3123038 RepID=A0ABU8TM50_9HYPH